MSAMDEQQDHSKQIHPQSIRNRVVVFDIDKTLCRMTYGEKYPEECLSECPVIDRYAFLPHLQILFEYLLKHEVRVVFFSAGEKKRNESLIPALLTSFWGTEKYEALRAKGQFTIFSDVHCRKVKKYEFDVVKNLKVVIRKEESLSDVILVDDDSSWVADDQHPFVCSIDLCQWYFAHHEKYVYNNCKNSVYYLLGLFKTAFEHEKYKELALREAFRQILPEEYNPTHDADSFKQSMIDIGLAEVQNQIPDARLFGSPSIADDVSWMVAELRREKL